MRRSAAFLSIMVLVICAVLMLNADAFAKKGGNGQGKSEAKSKSKTKVEKTVTTNTTTGTVTTTTASKGRPPGWDKGRKTGWRGGKYPPGWSKWSETEQIKWVGDRDSAHLQIVRVMNTYNIPNATQDQIRNGFDDAILGGMAVAGGMNKLISGLKDPNQRKLFMINSTQNVLEFLK